MRRAGSTWWLWLALALGGCPETVRCPDGQVFDDDGACVPIPDAGPEGDAGSDEDAG